MRRVARGAVRLLQEVQDLRIEDEGHDAEERDGDRRDEEAVADLGEVFGQRHAGLGFTESRHVRPSSVTDQAAAGHSLFARRPADWEG